MFIVYSNGKEVIITIPENELKTREEYGIDSGRNLDEDYDRFTIKDNAITVVATVKVSS